jgi:hypothetical protein
MGCSFIPLLSSLWSVGEKEKKSRGCKEKIPKLAILNNEWGLGTE